MSDVSSTVDASNRAIAIMTFVAIIGIGSLFFTVFYIVASWWQAWRAQDDPTAKYEAASVAPSYDYLPAVLPAQAFDASDTTPTLVLTTGTETGTLTYCPACYVIWMNVASIYLEPAGRAEFCLQHAYSTLARALLREEEAR